MRSAGPILMLSVCALALAACAGGQQRRGPSPAVINRALATAPGAAQPSTIVATEIAFARAARENGQWTAFRMFAAPGALLHGENGPFAIEPWLATQSDPPAAVQWEPRAVAISCDGAVAVSHGRITTPEGKVGNFLTVWERQGSGEYRYVFDVGGLDVPQPPPRKPVEDGDIVVTSIDAVQGLVASCPRRDAAIPPPPAIPVGYEGKADARLSRDGTLRWRWEHRDDGTRFAAADYFYQGRWLTAFEQNLASMGGE
ncbi:MAG: hypothetical protein CVT75_06030 [Alphaproteobacteria bacterium HGW-Alphaproteobacteria-14]|nr:MAG: hypothetical protein CVT75_06030 [Alphaproteobacteria bacterium HGW-Alphaproteobacteria-14]